MVINQWLKFINPYYKQILTKQLPVLLIVMLTFSCAGSAPSVTPSSQPIACSVEQAAVSWVPTQPKLYLILVKGTQSYADQRNKDKELITNVLPKVLHPGDHIVVASMEQPTLGEAIFFDMTVPLLPTPYLEATPTLATGVPSRTPPAKTPFGPGAYQITKTVAVAQTAISSSATSDYNTWKCAVNSWQNRSRRQVEAFKDQEQKANGIVVSTLTQELMYNSKNINVVFEKKQVYESLALATTFFQSFCSEPQTPTCVLTLIILSDMIDFRSESKVNSSINFDNVNVYVIFQDCNYLEYEGCGERRKSWIDFLENHHARSPKVFSSQNAESALLEALR